MPYVLQRIIEVQIRRPWLFLGSAGFITVAAVFFALRLHLYTGLETLLPQSRASVIELERVTKLTTGVSGVSIVMEGSDSKQLRDYADALVPKLKAIGEPYVASASSGVHDAVSFFGPRAGLFLETDRLTKLRDEVKQRYSRALVKASGLGLGLDEEAEAEPEPFDLKKLTADLVGDNFDTTRFPDGYYQSKDGRTLVVAIRSKVPNGKFEDGRAALKRIREVVANAKLPAEIKVSYGGDLTSGVSEFDSINRNLLEVGVLGSVLIAGIVLLYFMRLRTLMLMLIVIGVGDAWTFGMTRITIGHLNAATGFLFTIVTGNGINFAIICMARYLEARRLKTPIEESVRIAVRETWRPTLTAGFATGASYGALAATSFRGFHDFGFIGGIGMALCWLATYWVLPPLLIVTERFSPLKLEAPAGTTSNWFQRLRRSGVNFSRPFVWLVANAPGKLSILAMVLTFVGAVAGTVWVVRDPMEYNLKAIRTDVRDRAQEIRADKLAAELTGRAGVDGMAIVVERPEQLGPLRKALLARRDAVPYEDRPFEALFALDDYVPKNQEEKIPILLDLRRWILKAHERGAIKESDWKEITPLLPPEHLEPYDESQVPESIASSFVESDGRRGRIVYISPTPPGDRVDDAHYLFRWADSYRRTELPDGSVVLGSGRAVIYADMWQAVVEDVPKAIILSFFATLAVLILILRSARARIVVAAAMIQSAIISAGAFWAMGLRLNFINFIALPVTFGIAVDYSVNIVERYAHMGPGSMLASLRATGGAVLLCSFTTMLGYIALVQSNNLMIRSMGIASFVGEICCVFSAVLGIPAMVYILDKRKAARQG